MHTLPALAALLALGAVSAQAATTAPRVIATWTQNAALEGLTIAPDGALIITSNFDRKLLKLAPDGALSSFADLPAYPQVVVATRTGYLVTAHGKLPFADGKMPVPGPAGGPPPKMPNFHALSTQLLIVDAAGHVTGSIAGPPDAFFNGLAEGSGLVLIADSLGGRIWKVDLATRQVTPWLTDDLLTPAPGRPFPGANGLKIHGGMVYVSDTTRNAIYTVAIGPDGAPRGSLTKLAELPSPDDFDVAADGSVLIPSRGAIDRITADGKVNTLVAKGCEGCDAALLRANGQSLVLVTHGAGQSRVMELAVAR